MSTASSTSQLRLRDEAVAVRGDELERLLDALARLGRRDADAVAEQITALRLVGGVIHLTPTEAELAALALALAALGEDSRPFGPSLQRLAADCAGENPLAENPCREPGSAARCSSGEPEQASDETPGREPVAQARVALSADEVARATEIGRQLTLAEALELARPEAPIST